MHQDIQNGFRALADPTRRDILHRLASGEHTIAQLTQHFDMTRAAVKKHLTVLTGVLRLFDKSARYVPNHQ